MTDGTVERQGLAARLGAFVHDLDFNNLPAEVVEAAKGRILDTLSCCLAGRDLPPSRIAADMSRSVAGECAVIGYERRTGMLEAALANGTMAHSTSQDDVISGIAHGGSAVVPAALAVGEQERASGAEVIAAVVAGYEMVWRILKAVGRVAHPAFRPGTIFTALGAAAAASRLMGLDAERTGHALGYAASLTPGTPNEGWWGGTMEPIIEIGMTARIGLLAAQFARAGGTAAPLVFEGPHGFLNCWAGRNDRVEQALDGLGRDFAVTRTYIKPFAACGANQVPIQVARTLASHGLGAEDIERIVEKLRPGAKDYAGLDHAGPFTSHVQALMSMQFCAAAAVL
ncbi:MAG: MmgE/PrpD family protein, partial [Proteobacteria bacterium]|nr:MmgE/PrpD family protein [Pseudomonadota bacterium]